MGEGPRVGAPATGTAIGAAKTAAGAALAWDIRSDFDRHIQQLAASCDELPEVQVRLFDIRQGCAVDRFSTVASLQR